MGGFFAMDGKGFRFFSTASELVILNLLWLICCIPLVTVGAATTALYTVIIRMVKNEDSYLVKGFFTALKENFIQATCIWLILAGAVAVLYFDFYFSSHAPVEGAAVLFIPFVLIAVLVAFAALYAFPMQAVFVNRVGRTLKNSLLMALAHLPLSAAALAVALGPAVVPMLFSRHPGAAIFFDCVIGFAFFAWVNAHIFVKIFQKYIDKIC